MAAKETVTLTPVPEYKHCKKKQIIDWCKENNKVDWLKATKAEIVTAAKAEGKHPGFFALRKAFYLAYAPEQIPTKANTTVWDEIDAL